MNSRKNRFSQTFRSQSQTDTVVQVLSRLIPDMQSAAMIRESMAIARWEEAAGPVIAGVSRAESIRDGVLMVKTRSSVWSQELMFQRENLVEKLNRLLGGPIVKDIRFRPWGKEENPPPMPPKIYPTSAELEAVRLTQAEREKLRRELDLAAQVQNEKLRISLQRTLLQEIRLHHWKKQNGWLPCKQCSALYWGSGTLCPLCAAEEWG